MYALESLINEAEPGKLVIGRGDVPQDQQQPITHYLPDEGNLAITGTSGSGKSTALRTVAISAAMDVDDPTHVYGLDFSSGGLHMLEPLPHVAAIVGADDDERIGRVLRRLTAILDERARRFARVNVSTITEYRKEANRHEPRILLLVDGIAAFRETYEHVGYSAYFSMFNQIAADGRRLGIHVVVTGDRPGALSTTLASMMQAKIVMRLASADDYMLSGVPGDILTAASAQGRGIMAGREIQVAVFGGDTNVAVQARAVEQLAERMRQGGVVSPEPVARLSDRVALEALPATTPAGMPSFGVADETLAPIGIIPQGVLMVTGPPGSGRSSALLTLAQSVRRMTPGARIVHMAPSPSTLSGLGVWSDTATGNTAVVGLANEVMSTLSFGSPSSLVVVIESLTEFTGTEAESELSRLVKALADASAFVVGEAEVSTWGQAWTLAQPFKSARRGLLLCPSGVEADTLLSTPIGTIRRHDFPPGRGVLVEKGKGVWMQVAQPVI